MPKACLHRTSAPRTPTRLDNEGWRSSACQRCLPASSRRFLATGQRWTLRAPMPCPVAHTRWRRLAMLAASGLTVPFAPTTGGVARTDMKKARCRGPFCLSGPGFPGPFSSPSHDQTKRKSLVVRLPPIAARPRMPISCTASVKSVPPPAYRPGTIAVRPWMVPEKSPPSAANSTW